ncbi:MAG: DUF448 domain-containing protein [Eubacteriales bacterium]|nr:DUF448 domain-containing protein [Clostridiales bacterium]MDY5835589.1 DUF448 domain-containing protein [Eubacteriales bacterium]
MSQGRKNKTVERMCAVCRQRYPQKDLMRFCLQKDGKARLDLKGKSQGRGVYLCHSYACLEKVLSAPAKGKAPLKLEAESRAILEGLHAMRKDQKQTGDSKTTKIKQLLGQARKAGLVSLGFDAVKASLDQGQVKLIVMATDMGPSSLRKIRPSLAEHPVQTLAVLSKEDLAQCMGRPRLALCGVLDEGLAQAIMTAMLGPNPPRQIRENNS